MRGNTVYASLIVGLWNTLAIAQSNIDDGHKYAWCENVGWMNWRDANAANDGVVVGPDFLAGYIWAENVGWINLGSGNGPYANNNDTDFGVNILPGGDLEGFAWGENIGWINFDTRAVAPYRARFDLCVDRFGGHAWGENVGWINLDDAAHFVALGPDCHKGDVACDDLIGLRDYAEFKESVFGPGMDSDCPLFDFDGDGDVDLADFAAFAASFTGK